MFSRIKCLGAVLLIVTLFSSNLPSACAEKPSERQTLLLRLAPLLGGSVITQSYQVDVSPGGFIESADLPFPSLVSIEGRNRGRAYEITIESGPFVLFLDGESEKGNSHDFRGRFLLIGPLGFVEIGTFDGLLSSIGPPPA